MTRELEMVAARALGNRETLPTRRAVLERTFEGLWPPRGQGFEEALRALATELVRARAVAEQQATATTENTAAIVENTSAQLRRSAGGGASSVRALARVFTSGLGIAPLARGIAALFRREEEPQLTPLIRYLAPSPVQFEGYLIRKNYFSNEESGYGPAGMTSVMQGSGPADSESEGARPVNITIQVQAMDSQSFLDHSWEIARAVKQAMLESHALNDVVMEL